MSEENTLHLAITMAGAVSAGAYTAGVMDYLLEALDEWERLKRTGNPAVPKHNIKLDILSGASAGGMTAAITAVALHYQKKQSICSFSSDGATAYGDCKNPQELESRKKNNRLYDSWVNLTSQDMLGELLKTDDEKTVILKDEDGRITGSAKSCISALNSNFIPELARKALSAGASQPPLLPPYVSENLRLFVTLTNLDGYKKVISFQGGSGANFLMYDHRDVAFFRFNPLEEPVLDGSLPVDFKNNTNTDLLMKAGIATGAFPIGLAYQTFSREVPGLQADFLLKTLHKDPKDLLNLPLTENKYRATFLDGGIINNEPFDLTERLFTKNPEIVFTPDDAELNSVILLIDPFPSEIIPTTNYGTDLNLFPYNLLSMIGNLVSAVRTQVLVKTDLIRKAISGEDFSCFIMAPRRRNFLDKTKYEAVDGSRAIASGSLGGFSGFLNKKFREHDFYLGRINCKSFLQKHFRLPADTTNKIFTHGYSAPESKMFTITDEKTGKTYLPIIPDVNVLLPNDPKVDDLYKNLKFPSLTRKEFKKDFDNHESALVKRVKFVINNNAKLNWLMRTALWWAGSQIYDAVFNFVDKGLVDWKILLPKEND